MAKPQFISFLIFLDLILFPFVTLTLGNVTKTEKELEDELAEGSNKER